MTILNPVIAKNASASWLNKNYSINSSNSGATIAAIEFTNSVVDKSPIITSCKQRINSSFSMDATSEFLKISRTQPGGRHIHFHKAFAVQIHAREGKAMIAGNTDPVFCLPESSTFNTNPRVEQ